MPAYNEEGAISRAIADIRAHVLALLPDAEIVVVDDGSKDKTGGILDALAREEPRLRVLHKPNGGHGSAVIAGADIARGEWLFFIDSDRQIPLESFAALWRAVEQGAGAAFGVRRRRNDPRVRLWLTGLIRHSLYVLFGVRLYDANVPYKLVPRALWRDARALIPDVTLAPSLFLAVFLARRGVRIAEVEVAHRERQTGEGIDQKLEAVSLLFSRLLTAISIPTRSRVMTERCSIAIVGAGPTGLTAAWRLHELGYTDWLLFERDAGPGGLASSVVDDAGFVWDLGGHVLFSHYGYFDRLMEQALGDAWVEHIRESWVWIRDRWVPYHFRTTSGAYPKTISGRACRDLQISGSTRGNKRERPANFREWLLQSFGPGLCETFMFPYNRKVWAYDPCQIECRMGG